jgi:uncharacterized membrane protein
VGIGKPYRGSESSCVASYLKRGELAWPLAYVYIVYVMVGQLPGLSGLSVFSVEAASVLLALLFLFSSYVYWGLAKASKYLVGTWLVAYAVEFVGVTTGYPFGHYAYTSAMSPFIGPVPLFIPFLWSALGYFALRATGTSILAPSVLMVLLDVSFDPSFSMTLWHWRSTPGPLYFGVPLLNFFGWFVASVLIFGLFWALVRAKGETKRGMVLSGGVAQGVGFYFLFGLSNVVSLLEEGLAEAAAVSTLLFAVASALAWRYRARAGAESPLHGPERQPASLAAASEPRRGTTATKEI